MAGYMAAYGNRHGQAGNMGGESLHVYAEGCNSAAQALGADAGIIYFLQQQPF